MDTGTLSEHRADHLTTGAALAAYAAAGIGAFAMGLFVILNESGAYTAPSLYGPAGGVTGRTAFAVIVWLIAWAVLHNRWKDREISPRRVLLVALLLILLGVVLTFPPIWGIF